MSSQKYSKGLAGVIAGETAIATVGKKGHGLMYRGYSIDDLTANCIFEEVAYLLTRGHLPNQTELNAYKKKINSLFELPGVLRRILELTPANCHPMDVLKTTCAVLGTLYPEDDINGNQSKQIFDITDRLLASFPSAITYHYNFHFKGLIIDTKSLSVNDTIAEHFLRLLHSSTPTLNITPLMIRCLDISLICYAEHGFAASTFALRVTTSTLSDSYSAICSAIGTLRGPLHGGANEKAFHLISSYNDSNSVRQDILNKLKNREKIMGFGHRVYRTNDPRSKIMKKLSDKLSDDINNRYSRKDLCKISAIIEETMWNEKKLFPNVDFPVAMAYHQCGIPTNLFTPLFVCARTSGWMANIIEQRLNNRLIRPSSIYVGPMLKKYVPINYRKQISKL